MQKTAKIILGVDPGTLLMGYGIIEVREKSVMMKAMHALKLPSHKDNYERLQLIHQKIEELITLYRPDEFAIEAPFFGKNVQSMLKLGRAQGVAIAAAMSAGLPVTEYSPRKVKQSVTGNGNADKEQVWKMLKHLLALEEEPLTYDATDALAVAVCHHFQSAGKISNQRKKISNWHQFIRDNPARLRNGSR